MNLIDLLNDRRMDLTIREYWVVTFCFGDVLNNETTVDKELKIGFSFGEYYYDDFYFTKYYKRFGNLLKNISETLLNKEVKNIRIGCSGRKWEATYNLTTEELNTTEKFFNLIK